MITTRTDVKNILISTIKYYDDDLIQVGMLAAFTAEKKYIDKQYVNSSLRNYLFTAVKRDVIDYLRKQKPTGLSRYGGDGIKTIDINSKGLSEDDKSKLMYSDNSIINSITLKRIIEKLTRKFDKRSLRVCYLYTLGLSLKEAGESIGVTEGRACQIVKEFRKEALKYDESVL